MADIFQEVDEDVRRERAVLLWQRYRGIVLGGAALIVIGTAGYVFWQDYQRRQDEAMGTSFAVAAAEGQGDPTKAIVALDTLGGTGTAGYPLIARFRSAELKLKGTDKTAGIAALRAIGGDGAVPQTYRDLAVLIAGYDTVDTAPPAETVSAMQPLTIAPNPWRFSAFEVTALAKLKAGDQDAAVKIYQQLADDLEAPQSLRARAAEILGGLRHQG